MRISVRVIPRSHKNEISRAGDVFTVRVTAPPVDGAANEALVTFLAERLGLPKRAVRIVQGATSRQKVLQIEEPSGLTQVDLEQRLSLPEKQG